MKNELDLSENKVYQNIRAVLVTARQKAYAAINSASVEAYQDIGQIDFYVRYFDDQIKLPEDNPTLGIILCADKHGRSILINPAK